jgi:thiamine-phosphate pyrophosphorylase
VATFAAPWLYIITDRRLTGGRPLVEVVAQALGGAVAAKGRVAVQLREKDLGGRELFELARALRAVTAAAGAPLFVNDRIDVALAAGADGVHLGGGSLSPAQARRIAPAMRIAASTHNEAELQAAAAAGVDFVVFGPVFDTPSKPDPGAVTGLDGLARACRHRVPVLALGGIEPENAQACLATGAAGLASIHSVISATNSAQRVSAFLACKTHVET